MIKADESIVVKAIIRLKSTIDGGRVKGFKTGYRPNHVFDYNYEGNLMHAYIGEIQFDNKELILPGESNLVTVTF
jgi:hypothetical protein